MFSNILVPVDFGSCSEHALEFAERIVGKGGSIRLLYVLDEKIVLPFDGMLDLSIIEDSARRSLERMVEGRKRQGVSLGAELVRGEVSEEVLAAAARGGHDLLVVGSHGRKGLRRLLLGSVAERIVRRAGLPVCVVKEGPRRGPSFGKIGFAADFSPAGDRAFDRFRALCLEHGASAFILHVQESEAVLAGFAVPAGTIEHNLNLLREQRRRQCEEMVEALEKDGVKAEGVLLEGQPWEELADFASRRELDLLVMGTHGYRGVDRLFLGSVAEKTMRMIEEPLLVVPGS